MADWSAAQYLAFADERTRPAADLLARVGAVDPALCVDLGCGPGNSTELLARRFPHARILGLDASPDMLAAARQRLPTVRFVEADLASWTPTEPPDLLFANAVLQWLPDHAALLRRLVGWLAPGGWLAVQMPDNRHEPTHEAMHAIAAEPPWAEALAGAAAARTPIGAFADYYGWLTEACDTIDLWRTTYVHPLASAGAIVEWVKGTGLRPFIDPLDGAGRAAFLARYEALIAASYPAQPDGKVLLRFPRLFIVGRKRRPPGSG